MRRAMSGISSRHGMHQVAQKLTSVSFAVAKSILTLAPSTLWSVTGETISGLESAVSGADGTIDDKAENRNRRRARGVLMGLQPTTRPPALQPVEGFHYHFPCPAGRTSRGQGGPMRRLLPFMLALIAIAASVPARAG